MKSVGHDVNQKAADELVGVERHKLVAGVAFGPVMLPFEGHALAIEGSGRPFIAAPIWCQQRASRRWLIGRAENRTYCKMVIIWRLSVLDLVARNNWTPRRNFAV